MSESVVIIGSGTMGSGISRLLKRLNVEHNLISVRKEGSNPEFALDVLKGASLIIECVTEDIDTKRNILGMCSKLNSESVIATCTSSIMLANIEIEIQKPERFCGIHFMNPPTVIDFVEFIPGSSMNSEYRNRVLSWLDLIGRKTYSVLDTPGFVINALLFSLLNRAAYLLQENKLSCDEIDELMVGVCGHKMGPFRTFDLIGLDTSLNILNSLHRQSPILNLPPANILISKVEKGELGKKSGHGFYRY